MSHYVHVSPAITNSLTFRCPTFVKSFSVKDTMYVSN